MELIVVGSSGTYPRPGGACNCYIVRDGGSSIIIDLGPGSLSRAFEVIDPATVDAFFISHLHPDHFLDIYPYRYYLQFSADESLLPISVFAPRGAKERIEPLFSDRNHEAFERVFAWDELGEGKTFTFGSMSVTANEVPHLPPTFSLTINSGGKRIFYSADTGYDKRLIELAGDADLLLCEASLRPGDSGKVAHLTGAQAGEVAELSGAGRLLLTHLWPHYDRREILADAQSSFKGRIDLADEGMIIKI